MGTRWHTGRLLRMAAAPCCWEGCSPGSGHAASALTCQARTGGQPANPDDTGGGDGLNGVTMINACDVWVVGGTGGRTTLIEHWTGGSTWTVVPSPSPGEGLSFLTSVSGISPIDIWAVGTDSSADGRMERSLILHYDGKSWTQVASPSPGGQFATFLTGVTATSGHDVWAVGTTSAARTRASRR